MALMEDHNQIKWDLLLLLLIDMLLLLFIYNKFDHHFELVKVIDQYNFLQK